MDRYGHERSEQTLAEQITRMPVYGVVQEQVRCANRHRTLASALRRALALPESRAADPDRVQAM